MSSLRFALLLALAPMVACDDGRDPFPGPTPEPETGISISPSEVSLLVGELVALRISGASTILLATWTSDNPAVASVGAGGLVRGLQAGSTIVTVYVGEQRASVLVTVRSPSALR